MNFNGAVESVRRLSDRGYRFMIVIRTCAGIALIVGATNYASAQQAWLPAGDQRIQSTHSIDNELDHIAMTLQLSQQRCSEVSSAAAATPCQDPGADRRQSERIG
jgi:hypothetical protein